MQVLGVSNSRLFYSILGVCLCTFYLLSKMEDLLTNMDRLNTERQKSSPPSLITNFNLEEHYRNHSPPSSILSLDNSFIDIQQFASEPFKAKEKKISMTIIVLTMDRPSSLLRLLSSLKQAHLGTHRIDLEIHQDSLPDSTPHSRTSEIVNSFSWPCGEYRKRIHRNHQGIVNMWLNSWIPNSDSDLGLILEDDQEVSPYFARWLISSHRYYVLNPRTRDREICSISLSRPLHPASNTLKDKPKSLEDFIRTSSPAYKYRMPSSWGLAPVASQWLEFRRWFHRSYSSTEPYVEGLDLYEYYKTLQSFSRQDTLWSIWFAAYSDISQCYTLYPHITKPFKLALLKNHQEKGLHTPFKRPQDNEILHVWSDSYISFPSKTPKYDYTGKLESWTLIV